MSIENEIKRGIINFAKEYSIFFNKEIIDDFMIKTYNRRKISLTNDTFLLVCEYLTVYDNIILTTLCKDFIKQNYPHIWGIMQSRYFVKSLIPNTDYLTIRQNIAIDYWYYKLCNYKAHVYDKWNDVVCDDITIQDRSKLLHKLHPSCMEYICRKNTHLREIRAVKETREYSINQVSEEICELIDIYIYYSHKDFTNVPYYTIKPDLDMRLYGYIPENKYDEEKWDIHVKWITGQYNQRPDYDYDVHIDREEIYDYILDDDDQQYRVRKRPDWC
jgi:hypothetical protein